MEIEIRTSLQKLVYESKSALEAGSNHECLNGLFLSSIKNFLLTNRLRGSEVERRRFGVEMRNNDVALFQPFIISDQDGGGRKIY